MDKRYKSKGVAMVGTVAALVAWILLSYGIFTVEGSQFQMMISSNQSLNAQKLAEIDAALIKMVNYEDITSNAALGKMNLHLDRGNIKSISDADGWQDEIIISNEKIKGNDPDHGRFRVATINIYREGDTTPRFSMQVPVTKSGQTYSRKTIDDFIEELKKKDKELEEKDKQLEAKDKQLEAKDKQLEAKDKQLEAADQNIASRISSMKSSLMSEIQASKCTCSRPTEVVTIVDPKPSNPDNPSGGGGSGGSGDSGGAGGGNADGGGSSGASGEIGTDGDGTGGSGGGGNAGGASGDGDDSGTDDNVNYAEQDLWEIDEWNHFNINKSFTAPCDGYIKIVNFSDHFEIIEHTGEDATAGDGDNALVVCIDGKVVELHAERYNHYLAGQRGYTSGLHSDHVNDNTFYRYTNIGDVTYEGKTIEWDIWEEDDGEGSSTVYQHTPYIFSPTLYNSGTPISKGSTFTLFNGGDCWDQGDGSFDAHVHYKVVFVPKK